MALQNKAIYPFTIETAAIRASPNALPETLVIHRFMHFNGKEQKTKIKPRQHNCCPDGWLLQNTRSRIYCAQPEKKTAAKSNNVTILP